MIVNGYLTINLVIRIDSQGHREQTKPQSLKSS